MRGDFVAFKLLSRGHPINIWVIEKYYSSYFSNGEVEKFRAQRYRAPVSLEGAKATGWLIET